MKLHSMRSQHPRLHKNSKAGEISHAAATFPAKRFVVEDLLVDGDKIALRVTVQGIPVAPGQPQPIIMEIFRIENGRVAEIWGAGILRRPES
jgi:predicted ester cyclase